MRVGAREVQAVMSEPRAFLGSAQGCGEICRDDYAVDDNEVQAATEGMDEVEELESEIQKLARVELTSLTQRFQNYVSDEWDRSRGDIRSGSPVLAAELSQSTKERQDERRVG